jgi:hypothetical protein
VRGADRRAVFDIELAHVCFVSNPNERKVGPGNERLRNMGRSGY